MPGRIARLYVDDLRERAETFALPAQAAHHAAAVLRLKAGDGLVLFDGRGGEYPASIATIERNSVRVRIGGHLALERESPLRIVLAQGISAGERMDFTIQKAVELGVAAIVPLACEKSVVRLTGERAAARVTHWRRVAISACEQCGRNRVPTVGDPLPVARYCGQVARAADGASRLVLAPEADLGLKAAAENIRDPVVLAVGPEAGFGAAEEAQLVRAGFVPVRLGPRVLRTETAALAALAALNGLLGDF